MAWALLKKLYRGTANTYIEHTEEQQEEIIINELRAITMRDAFDELFEHGYGVGLLEFSKLVWEFLKDLVFLDMFYKIYIFGCKLLYGFASYYEYNNGELEEDILLIENLKVRYGVDIQDIPFVPFGRLDDSEFSVEKNNIWTSLNNILLLIKLIIIYIFIISFCLINYGKIFFYIYALCFLLIVFYLSFSFYMTLINFFIKRSLFQKIFMCIGIFLVLYCGFLGVLLKGGINPFELVIGNKFYSFSFLSNLSASGYRLPGISFIDIFSFMSLYFSLLLDHMEPYWLYVKAQTEYLVTDYRYIEFFILSNMFTYYIYRKKTFNMPMPAIKKYEVDSRIRRYREYKKSIIWGRSVRPSRGQVETWSVYLDEYPLTHNPLELYQEGNSFFDNRFMHKYFWNYLLDDSFLRFLVGTNGLDKATNVITNRLRLFHRYRRMELRRVYTKDRFFRGVFTQEIPRRLYIDEKRYNTYAMFYRAIRGYKLSKTFRNSLSKIILHMPQSKISKYDSRGDFQYVQKARKRRLPSIRAYRFERLGRPLRVLGGPKLFHVSKGRPWLIKNRHTRHFQLYRFHSLINNRRSRKLVRRHRSRFTKSERYKRKFFKNFMRRRLQPAYTGEHYNTTLEKTYDAYMLRFALEKRLQQYYRGARFRKWLINKLLVKQRLKKINKKIRYYRAYFWKRPKILYKRGDEKTRMRHKFFNKIFIRDGKRWPKRYAKVLKSHSMMWYDNLRGRRRRSKRRRILKRSIRINRKIYEETERAFKQEKKMRDFVKRELEMRDYVASTSNEIAKKKCKPLLSRQLRRYYRRQMRAHGNGPLRRKIVLRDGVYKRGSQFFLMRALKKGVIKKRSKYGWKFEYRSRWMLFRRLAVARRVIRGKRRYRGIKMTLAPFGGGIRLRRDPYFVKYAKYNTIAWSRSGRRRRKVPKKTRHIKRRWIAYTRKHLHRNPAIYAMRRKKTYWGHFRLYYKYPRIRNFNYDDELGIETVFDEDDPNKQIFEIEKDLHGNYIEKQPYDPERRLQYTDINRALNFLYLACFVPSMFLTILNLYVYNYNIILYDYIMETDDDVELGDDNDNILLNIHTKYGYHAFILLFVKDDLSCIYNFDKQKKVIGKTFEEDYLNVGFVDDAEELICEGEDEFDEYDFSEEPNYSTDELFILDDVQKEVKEAVPDVYDTEEDDENSRDWYYGAYEDLSWDKLFISEASQKKTRVLKFVLAQAEVEHTSFTNLHDYIFGEDVDVLTEQEKRLVEATEEDMLTPFEEGAIDDDKDVDIIPLAITCLVFTYFIMMVDYHTVEEPFTQLGIFDPYNKFINSFDWSYERYGPDVDDADVILTDKPFHTVWGYWLVLFAFMLSIVWNIQGISEEFEEDYEFEDELLSDITAYDEIFVPGTEKDYQYDSIPFINTEEDGVAMWLEYIIESRNEEHTVRNYDVLNNIIFTTRKGWLEASYGRMRGGVMDLTYNNTSYIPRWHLPHAIIVLEDERLKNSINGRSLWENK